MHFVPMHLEQKKEPEWECVGMAFGLELPLTRRQEHFSSMLWHGGQRLGVFLVVQKGGGAAQTTFPLSAMLLGDFNISFLGSDACSALLPASALLWCLPTAMEIVTGKKCLREGAE